MDKNLYAHHQLLALSENKHPSIHSLILKNGILDFPEDTSNSVFEFIAKTIIGQQLSNKAANTIWHRVKCMSVSKDINIFDLFSEQNNVEIKSCGVSKNKMKAIQALKTKLSEDEMFEARLINQPYDVVKQMLTSIWGIGIWTADMTSIFHLKMPDVFPENDVAIANGLTRLCGEKSSYSDVASFYSPFRSYLCLHVWKGIDLKLI